MHDPIHSLGTARIGTIALPFLLALGVLLG